MKGCRNTIKLYQVSRSVHGLNTDIHNFLTVCFILFLFISHDLLLYPTNALKAWIPFKITNETVFHHYLTLYADKTTLNVSVLSMNDIRALLWYSFVTHFMLINSSVMISWHVICFSPITELHSVALIAEW